MDKTSEISENAKISGIVAYLTFIGLIIAFFINMEEKHPFANFHIRQSLGIQTLFYAVGALLPLIPNAYAGYGFLLFFFVVWSFGMFSAATKQQKPVPIIGGFFQTIFKFIK